LLNFNNFIPESSLPANFKLYLKFQLNEIKNQTDDFKIIKPSDGGAAAATVLNKEQITLFDHE